MIDCVITAGPTFEPIDRARRITNFSTGALGTRLANYLVRRGRRVLLLRSSTAVAPPPLPRVVVETFSTTEDLSRRLEKLSADASIQALFHAAAVCDFWVAGLFAESADGERRRIQAGKAPTNEGVLWAELRPTPKILARLAEQFPSSRVVGWKYAVDGTRTDALEAARSQMESHDLAGSVANGPAYGPGFGWIPRGGESLHLPTQEALFERLNEWVGPVTSARGSPPQEPPAQGAASER